MTSPLPFRMIWQYALPHKRQTKTHHIAEITLNMVCFIYFCAISCIFVQFLGCRLFGHVAYLSLKPTKRYLKISADKRQQKSILSATAPHLEQLALAEWYIFFAPQADFC